MDTITAFQECYEENNQEKCKGIMIFAKHWDKRQERVIRLAPSHKY